MLIQPGATSVSLYVELVDDAGAPLSGRVAADFPPTYYVIHRQTPIQINLADLSAPNAGFTPSGVVEAVAGSALYRLDVPNEAWAGAWRVTVFGATTGIRLRPLYLEVQYAAADLWRAHGTDITESATGRLAAAIKKFFDVATPTAAADNLVTLTTLVDNLAVADHVTNAQAAASGNTVPHDNGDGTYRLDFLKRDGATVAFTKNFNPATGQRW